ncbi:hypothetical protein L9F63_006656, partial [Diploptera punctata]
VTLQGNVEVHRSIFILLNEYLLPNFMLKIVIISVTKQLEFIYVTKNTVNQLRRLRRLSCMRPSYVLEIIDGMTN